MIRAFFQRVSNGTRTRDIRHHKPALYQLSYTHHVPTGAGNHMSLLHVRSEL